MSYRLHQVRSNPVAAWILDDTIPFQEHSGSGFAATATAAPVTSTPPLVAGAAYAPQFHTAATGSFVSPVFKQGLEDRQFVLEAWVYPVVSGKQQILSHSGQYDGLWIEGNVIHFSTQYSTAGTSDCFFDLVVTRAAHVVGQHTSKHNELWVDGVLVHRVDLTDAQKNDTYITTDGSLYCGGAVAEDARLAVNGVALYNHLAPEQIAANYRAGRSVVNQVDIAPQFSGVNLHLDAGSGSTYFDRTWDEDPEFNQAYMVNAASRDNRVKPLLDAAGLTLAGSWEIAVPLDASGVSATYGVMAEWSGKDITVQARIDNGAWSTLTSGKLISAITNGFTTTNKSLQVRVTFATGVADAATYLESLTLVGFKNNTFDSTELRAITATHPAVLRKDYEPIMYRDDNGVTLNGGTLTIGLDTSEELLPTRTVEFWIKVITTSWSVGNVTGLTRYVNGATPGPGFIAGQWYLLHYTSPTDMTVLPSVTGQVIVGQAAVYPTTLTADDIAHIYKSYTGAPVVSFVDAGSIGVTEFGMEMYLQDWSIESG